MKKRNLLAGIVLASLAFIFVSVRVVNAQSFRSGDNVTVSQNETIDQSLFVAGRNIDIGGVVQGDIFCAGQTVNISATVHGDVICGGQTVNISGTVDGDVRLAGQSVNLSATVSGNATIGGQTFTLDSKGKIGKDLTIGSDVSKLNGTIGRDIAGAGSTIIINNSIGRDVQANITKLELTSTAVVKGNIDYTSANQIIQRNGSTVEGSVKQTVPTEPASTKHGAVFGFNFGWFLFIFVMMLTTALVLVLLFPRLVHTTSEQAVKRPLRSFLTGVFAMFVVPAAIAILLISVVGMPLAFVAALLWVVVLILSGPMFGYYLGRMILRNSTNALAIMLVGGSLLAVLYFVPILGFFALCAAGWFGTGMILLEAKNRMLKPHYVTSNYEPAGIEAKTETKSGTKTKKRSK